MKCTMHANNSPKAPTFGTRLFRAQLRFLGWLALH